MKYAFWFLIIVAGLWHCKVQQEIAFEFPALMPEDVKLQNMERCKTGLELYRNKCGGCHTEWKGKREMIPDFSLEVISTYAFRSVNKQHIDSVQDDRISDEEMTFILTFLTYKQKQELNRK